MPGPSEQEPSSERYATNPLLPAEDGSNDVNGGKKRSDKSRLIAKSESNVPSGVSHGTRRVKSPACDSCDGHGRSVCLTCDGAGRLNHPHLPILPKVCALSLFQHTFIARTSVFQLM